MPAKPDPEERYRDSLKYYPRELWHFPGDVPNIIAPDRIARPGRALGALPFVVEPGQRVRWGNRSYTLRLEGRYTFMKGCLLVRQAIAFKRDEVALFRGLMDFGCRGGLCRRGGRRRYGGCQ